MSYHIQYQLGVDGEDKDDFDLQETRDDLNGENAWLEEDDEGDEDS